MIKSIELPNLTRFFHDLNVVHQSGIGPPRDDDDDFTHYKVERIQASVEPKIKQIFFPASPTFNDTVKPCARFYLKVGSRSPPVAFKLRYFKNDAVKITLKPANEIKGVIKAGQSKKFT